MSFDLKTGLIVYYPFSGNALDVSGNNINGSVDNAILTTDRKNANNSAYEFSLSAISFTAPSTLSIKKEITICAWIYTLDDGTQLILGEHPVGYTATRDNSISLSIGNKTLIGRVTSDYGGGGAEARSSITAKNWHFVAYTFDFLGLSSLYVNGNKVATSQGIAINHKDYSKTYYLGRAGTFKESYFRGKIDDVRVYNRALNEYEIKMIYQQ
jgi:hypothetical protein